jgi:hypothetical protein
MKREIDCLIAAGTEDLAGPQYLASSTVFALAKAMTAQGRKTGILVIDADLDPSHVSRDESADIVIYRSAKPVSTLPALSAALGQPRLLLLPNQLEAYAILQTPGLDATIWLGEDDLALLGDRWMSAPHRLWADSAYVAAVAKRLTQCPVQVVAPPLGPAAGQGSLPSPKANCLAVVGARPRDGLALTLSLAKRRSDLHVIVVDWPRLSATARQAFFTRAADCGNIDWRRPDGPAALLTAVAEAGVILVPAMEPIGHRDWICQMRLAGRSFLGSDLGAVPDLLGNRQRILPASSSPDLWLQHLDRLRHLPTTLQASPAGASLASEANLTTSYDSIVSRFLAPSA